jgi:ATP-dependent helicase HrpA
MSSSDLVKHLTLQLPLCLNQDRHPLKRQLDRLRSELKKGKAVEAPLSTLAGRIER